LLRQPISAQKGKGSTSLQALRSIDRVIIHAHSSPHKTLLPQLIASSLARLCTTLPAMASDKAPTDSAGDRGFFRVGEGRFGRSPMPSEHNVLLEEADGYFSEQAGDVFGLVLILGSVQPIWHLRSLFSYRGIWQGDKRMMQQNVVITIATGSEPVLSRRL
jgi:hypothetical protein